jgi:hypothetical protein
MTCYVDLVGSSSSSSSSSSRSGGGECVGYALEGDAMRRGGSGLQASWVDVGRAER